ncbi:MAG: energy-coupling factor transporter ATPase [Lachnospiraceae bacterium]|nr:energy-coupling factor transporter ATPase [Lachnospiraceae bacterium]
MSKLSLENVTYRYSVGTPFCKTALDGVSVSFEENRVIGLIGHTGCGKSTLVQMLNGLLKPTEGRVFLDGKDIWENPKEISAVRYRVGLVFQYPEYQLFEETVRQDIAFGPTNMGLPQEEIDRRVEEAALFVGLEKETFDQSPFELSGGQKRRVAIAGVIAMGPEVLILDEPAAGLDPMGREEILGGVRSFQKEKKSTVIIVSHSMEDMASYADELVVMDHGKVARTGSCRDIFSDRDSLLGYGLDVPQITRFLIELNALGVPVRTDLFTVEDVRKELLRLYPSLAKGGKR